MDTAGVIRGVLIFDMAAIALLALFYLRQRRMSWTSWLCWGLLAVLLPVLGPFLVIVNRPGKWHPDPFPSSQLRREVRLFWQGLAREVRYQKMRRTFRRK
jgi:hypothetical protein